GPGSRSAKFTSGRVARIPFSGKKPTSCAASSCALCKNSRKGWNPEMARFMFVVPPLAGHVNPTLAIGRGLMRAGHTVTWVGCAQRVRALLPDDFPLIPVHATAVSEVNSSWMERAQKVMGLESFQFFYQDFLVPLTDAMLPEVRTAIV